MRYFIPIIIFFTMYASADSKTWYVPDDFTNIQGAINGSNHRDTIIVRSGTYMELIDFLGKAITVKSEKGPDVTIIDGNQVGTVVTCQNGEDEISRLEGFTITNGSGTLNINGYWGGGMYIVGSSPMVVNCIFYSNSAQDGGGGVYVEDGSPRMLNNVFERNDSFYGGGMSVWLNSSPAITNNTFLANDAYYGGGLHSDQSSPVVTNSNFVGNRAGEWIAGGSGMNLQGGNPSFTNSIIWENVPEWQVASDHGWNPGSYSCWQGSGGSGTGNIDADPLFVDPGHWDDNGTPGHYPDDTWIDGGSDYHLIWDSPCINAGDNYGPSLPAMDFEGDPRLFPGNGTGLYLVGSQPQPAIVDIGADEYCLLKRQKHP